VSNDDKNYKIDTPDIEGMDADWDEDDFDVDVPAPAREQEQGETFDVPHGNLDEDDLDVDIPAPADRHSEQSEESQGQSDTPSEPVPADSHSEPVEESQGQSDAPSEAAPSDRHSEGSDSELEESQGQSDTPSEAVPSATSSEAPDQDRHSEPVEESQGQSDTPSEAPDSVGAIDDVVLPDDAPTDEAKAAAEEAALENYRSSMGETDAELADVSAYRNFRKTTKTGGPDKSKNKQSDFDIFANRHKAKTINQAVAQSDPIVYFYNACLTAKGEVLVFNVYQVLQDRFIGKIIPQLFTAVAEASSKIEELNMASLLAAIPVCQEFSMYDFVISISCRFFTKPALLDRLLKALPQEVPSNLIFAFDSVSLQNLGMAAKTGLGAIREKGVKVMLDNTEKVSMTALTELDYDYIRIDSRYYEMGNPKAEAYLGMIVNLAHGQGVKVVSSFCDNIDMCEYMLYMGVDAVQGNAVSKPFRTVPNAVKGITLLETMMDD